jgi:signal transduction histidine kinase
LANLARLLRTSAVRLALRYAVLYVLLTALALGVLFWVTARYLEQQVEISLVDELHELTGVDRTLGRAKLIDIIAIESGMGGKDERYFLLLASDGSRINGNLAAWPEQAVSDGAVHYLPIPDATAARGTDGDGEPYAVIASRLDDGARLLVAQNTGESTRLKDFIALVIAIILPLSALLALTAGLLQGRTLLARIDRINATAGKIAAGDLGQRVASSGGNDEFDELAQHLNAMLMRIEYLITGMRRVTDNVAHDLRHPLSRLRHRLELMLLEPHSAEEYTEAIRQAIADADDLLKTFNALLEIAQTEAGSFRGDWQALDLSELGQTLGELYQDVAEEAGIACTLHVTPGVRVRGNRHLLAQLIRNLLENAIQHAAAGGVLELTIDHSGDRPRLRVCDRGPGIPQDQRATVLERFARLDQARRTPGSGLGLSLVKAVAELHQAELRLEDNQPGLRVVLLFPPLAA